MGHEIGRTRAGGALIIAVAMVTPGIAWGCADSPAPGEPPTTQAAGQATTEVDEQAGTESELDEFGEESGDPSDILDDEPPLPVDEMDQPSLEEACFRGRQAACDLLGH